jgi:hypothetical protein
VWEGFSVLFDAQRTPAKDKSATSEFARQNNWKITAEDPDHYKYASAVYATGPAELKDIYTCVTDERQQNIVFSGVFDVRNYNLTELKGGTHTYNYVNVDQLRKSIYDLQNKIKAKLPSIQDEVKGLQDLMMPSAIESQDRIVENPIIRLADLFPEANTVPGSVSWDEEWDEGKQARVMSNLSTCHADLLQAAKNCSEKSAAATNPNTIKMYRDQAKHYTEMAKNIEKIPNTYLKSPDMKAVNALLDELNTKYNLLYKVERNGAIKVVENGETYIGFDVTPNSGGD